MRHILLGPEPFDFDEKVRSRGMLFLDTISDLNKIEWKGREYWRNCLPILRDQHSGICNYCATWIPYSTGSHSVDHFRPKNIFPELAYEWTNFRYASSRFNSRKGIKEIIDPVDIKPNDFTIDFSTMFIEPGVNTSASRYVLIEQTIEILRLNSDEDLIEERFEYYINYRSGEFSIEYLQRVSPFIAEELARQGLVNT